MMFAKLRKVVSNTKNKIVFIFFILSLSILFLFLQRRTTNAEVMMNAQPTVFNSAQLYLLDVFSRIKSDEELNDIKRIIGNYYAQKLDALTEKMWDSGELDQKRLDEINEMDLHAWLREQKAKEKETV